MAFPASANRAGAGGRLASIDLIGEGSGGEDRHSRLPPQR